MNAQEAIDLMERELENYKAMYMKHKKEQTTLEQFYKNKVEALSIVLESANKLHQDSLIRKFKDDNGEPMIHILLGNSYDKEKAEKIGLEVEE